jgi:hypothetical protein
MKKISAILLIISSLLALISQIVNMPEVLRYSSGFQVFSALLVWPLQTISLLILGIYLLNNTHSSVPVQSESSFNIDNSNPHDVPSTGLNIISFLIPLVGLIIYLIEKDKSPIKAISAGKSALWGVGISFILAIISIIISFSVINSIH